MDKKHIEFYKEWSEQKEYKSRIESCMKTIQQYKDKKIYVAFSGGKDSTAMLHMVSKIITNVPAFNYDHGHTMPRHYQKEIEDIAYSITNNLNVGKRIKGFTTDFFSKYEHELKINYDFAMIGLRKRESSKRKKRIEEKRSLGVIKEVWPLADLLDEDIFAYIISNNVKYHMYYDQYTLQMPHEIRFSRFFSNSLSKMGSENVDGIFLWKLKNSRKIK